ncbi:MAG: phosphotransferase [Acidimicrobiales bacterium]
MSGAAVPAGEVEAVFGHSSRDPLTIEPLPHAAVASATAGLWRVRVARRSTIVKLLAHAPDGGSPNWRSGRDERHWYYWRREAEAYRSGLLDGLGGGLRAPRWDLVADRDDGSIALWLEDLRGDPASSWSVDRYQTAARHLGRAQGEFITGRPLPDEPWLSRGWLLGYLDQPFRRLTAPTDPSLWRHPLLAGWFPEPPIGALRAMRADRRLFLGVLDRMPPTLCHLDFHPANLFDGGHGTTAAIDWSFVGIGALGEDAGNLVPDAVLDFHVGPEELTVLYDAVADGYTAGLRDAGWTGSDATVRLAMSATMGAKYAWIGPALARAAIAGRELLNGRPIAEALSWWAPTVAFLLDRAREARELAAQAQ